VGEGGGVKKLQDLLHASTHDHDDSADPTEPSAGPRTVGRLKAGRWAGGEGKEEAPRPRASPPQQQPQRRKSVSSAIVKSVILVVVVITE
jgi:hypothetical protein